MELMFRAFRRFAVAIAIVASPVTVIDHTNASEMDGLRTLEETFRAFQETAMRVNNIRATELARWNGPIYLAYAEGVERAKPEVDAAVARLATLAKVKVEQVPTSDPRVNFVVRASTRDSRGNARCYANIDWDGAGHMTKVELNVNMTNFERLTRCVNHEAVHGFGLRDHPDTAFSVLSYSYNTQAQLTDTDRVVLTTLYDARLPVTGQMDSIGRVACRLIAERLQISADRAASVCDNQATPPRTSVFARAHIIKENIGQ
jgi:hypothetical protein